jgi:hypothetical protein
MEEVNNSSTLKLINKRVTLNLENLGSAVQAEECYIMGEFNHWEPELMKQNEFDKKEFFIELEIE